MGKVASGWQRLRALGLKGVRTTWLLAAAVASPAWAALTVNSVDVPTLIGRGQTVTGTVQVTRASGSGNETVAVAVPALLEIAAPLPAGCTLAGASGAPQTLTCSAVNPGAVGASASFTFRARGLSLGGGSVSATSGISAASDSFSVISGGDLTVGKTISPSGEIINGATVTFTLTPTLGGDPLPAGAVITVTDQLPGGAGEFVLTAYSAPGYTCNSVNAAQTSRSLVCTLTGPAASLGAITVQGRPTTGGAGSLTNGASIADDATAYIDAVASNNTAQVVFAISAGADPSPLGTFPASVAVGTPQTLSVSYANAGPQTTVGGQLRVAVPPGFDIGTLPAGCVNSGPGTVNGVAGAVLTCTSGTVTSGGAQAFAIALTAPATPQAGNFGVEIITGASAELPGGLKDSNLGNNQILVPYNVVPVYSDLAITKNKTPGPIGAGSAMASTIVTTNTGIAPAVYSVGTGATPLRVVDTMFNEEEYVSASGGWTCTDQGVNSGGAGRRRVLCLRDAAGTLAVGGSVSLVVNTRAAAALPGPINLINTACTGAAALSQLGLTTADGPQPPDGNENAGADCASRGATGTPVVLGQAQMSVVKESSRDGVTWVDAVGAAPTVLAADGSLYWRITVTTPSTAANAVQATIPTLLISDTLPAILNVASPGAGIPGYQTPAAQVATTVLAGAANGSCPASVPAGSSNLSCTFTNVVPGTTLQAVVRLSRPFESGTFTNTATISSPNAVASATPGGQLQDAAALVVQGRVDPAVPSKTASPPNSGTSPRVGQDVSFSIVARNLGPNAITGAMTVTDVVDPTRFLVLSASAAGGALAPPMTCTVTTGTGLVSCATPAGSTVRRYDFYTISIVTRVLKFAPLPSPVVTVFNTAQVAIDPAQNCESLSTAAFGACNDGASTSNNSATAQVDIRVPQVDLVSKKARVLPSGQGSFGFTDPLRYRFRAQNNGPSRAENITVTDRITAPAGYTVTLVGVVAVNAVAAESGFARDNTKNIGSVACTQAAPNADVACTLAAGTANFLAPNSEVNFELTFTLAGPPAVISVGNAARVCSDETLSGHESSGSCVFAPPAAAGNNLASVNDVIFPKTDLAISKARITASPVNVNQPVEYAITVRNNGANPTTQIRFADVLPANFEWLSTGAFAPVATPGAFAGLSVSNLACTATPAAIVTPGQQQTVNCVLDGAFPGSAAAANAVAVRLYARPKQGFFTGPYLNDRANTATVSPGLDAGGEALSIDGDATNNTANAVVQVQATSLAGTVFEDRSRAGGNAGTPQAAAQEPRITGGTVRLTGTDLYGNAVNLLAPVDASGNYSFTGLAPSDATTGYTVAQVAQPSGFVNSPATPPAVGAAAPSAGGTYASGGSAGASSYSAVVLAGGAAAVRYNFPEVRVPSLAGFVYRDDNANGSRDAATDAPIAGATVQLLDATTGAVLRTTTTDAAGAYSFTALDPFVSYTLQEPLPTTPVGLRNGPVNPGLVNAAACASGCTAQADTPVAGTDRIAAIDLSAGTDGTLFNFGEVQTSSVSGLVWVDNNRDTVLDAGEATRLPGVEVRLVQGADCTSGTVVQTTQTLADGSYLFSNVRAFQNYLVCQTQPAGYGTGSANGSAGSNVATVSNLATAGSANNNFGETLASLAGSVYADTGAGVPAQFDNGVRDAAEAGIANVPVTLSGTNVLNQPVNITVNTDASGNYLFDNLVAPNAQGYTVTEGTVPPAAGLFLDGKDTTGSAGGTVGADVLAAINLAAGQQATGYLFGELPNTSISGTVYVDRNRNDTLDTTPTDARLGAVVVRLVRGADCSSGTELQRTTTNASGNYNFANVAAGGSYLVCESQPSGYGQGVETPGTGATAGAANSIAISNLPATGSAGNHFGERVAAIAGSVYADHSAATPANNNNGVRDAGETGIAGVPVTLLGRDINNALVSLSTVTDASGNYRFDDLLQASAAGYTVTEGAIPGSSGVYNDGLDRVGTAGGTGANDSTSAVPLGAGVVATNYDFGELPIAPITGTVFIDRDRDGVIDSQPADGRIAGVVVNLVLGANCGGAAVATATTDAAGNYAFSGISAGLTYTLCQEQPAAYGDGGVIAGGSGSSAAANAITLSNLPITGSAGNHFGEWVASLAGSVYADYSAATPANTDNGTRDAAEVGIAGVTVTLSGRSVGGASVLLTTTTDASGNYRFDDLLQSDATGYTVLEGSIPAGAGSFNDGRDTAGTAAGSTAVNDRVTAIHLGAAVQATGYLFGELPSTSISGTVYLDRDRDGQIDSPPTDGRIGGVVVNLVLGANCGGTLVATATTDASGNYSFSGISAGLTYTLCQVQPGGYADGGVNPGTAGSSGAANAITLSNLPAGGSTGNHFGERAGSIAGTVYLDTSNDGTQQPGEPGIAGVTVTLTGTDANGAVTRTTTTDATGNYTFNDLLAAVGAGYTVTEQAAQPAVGGAATLNGRSSAGSIAGTTTGSATPVATTPSAVSGITLAAGADSINNRFGELLPVGISGTVFIDVNDNGQQNPPADTGLGGVQIVITGTDDTGAAVSRTVNTAADGSYAVTDLRPGTYTVTEPTQPLGTSNGKTLPGSAGGTATLPAAAPSAISGIVLATSGATSTANNFAEIPNSSGLQGRVWLDSNNNGLIDGAETGIAGVAVELVGTDTAGRPVARSATTDASGAYSFAELSPGSYTLREPTQPADTVNGITVPGSRGGTATPVATTPSALSAISLGVGDVSSANNFGEVPGAQVAGRVYGDNNNNGQPDGTETGLGGVTLVLTGTDDLGNAVSITVATGADGSYSFNNLRPGNYVITQPTQPPGTVGGITTPGSAGGTATGPSVPASVISAVVLTPGARSTGNNFGELTHSPDLLVSKSLVEPRFTVGFAGSYRISVRNAGEIASSGAYTVSDRLPTGLTLAATPAGTGWACVGAAGAGSFACTSSTVLAAGATSADAITATVNVAAAAAANAPVNNVVMVDGGGEIDARRPSAAERDAFANNPASLPVCSAAVEHHVCRTPTPVQLAASISGTAWYDNGSSPRVLDSGDRRLPGWGVEIIDTATGAIVGRATTAADGSYRVADLMPGLPLAVRFRDPASGIVFGYPVNGDTAPGSSGATCMADAAATGTASSCVGTGNSPQLSVVLAPGQDLPQQSLPVDPSGVVYDSGLRTPVPGAVVTLEPVGACAAWDPATGLVGATLGGYTLNGGRVSMTVGADGFYQFLFGPTAPASCTFGLTVTPPPGSGYSFQSTAIPPSTGPLVPTGGAGSVFAVQPQAAAPTGDAGPATSYFLTLTSGSAGANIIHNHIPLDPALPTGIALAKTGDRSTAEIGDSVRYSITVRVTSGPVPRQTTVLDRLPAGFTYIRGTAMVGDTRIADPQGGVGPTLAFNLGPLTGGQAVLRYRVRVDVGAMQGDGVNHAQAHACGVPAGCVDAGFKPRAGSVATNEGSYRVKVSGGVFTTDACFAGKVFVDCNHNHVQDAEELGIPGVRLVMQDGTTLVSDSEGKYSMCGLPPRSAVLKVDSLTLPRGSRLTTSSNRNLGDGGSLWLDLKNGELHRADFVEGSCSNTVLEQTKARRAQGEVRAPEPEKKRGPVLRFDSKAHGKSTVTSPQQGTDGANQRVPKPRAPVPPPPGPVEDETNVPSTELPMNKPAPTGRDSGQAADAGGSHGAR